MVYWNLVCSVNCYYFSKIIDDQWINELKYTFNFSFQIRCPRMDQDFSGLVLVRDYLQTYSKCSTFYFVQSITLLTQYYLLFIDHLWRIYLPDGMICKYEFMCFSSFAAEKSLAFPSFTPSFCDHHNMPLLQGASLLSRRLQVFGWKKEWVHKRETREERGSISGFPPPVQLPESHCVIFQKFDRKWLTLAQTKGCTFTSSV